MDTRKLNELMAADPEAAQAGIDFSDSATNLDNDPMRDIAMQRANKILKKNKREIERLQKHAEYCLMTLNRDGYIYAIGKIKTIIRQPMDEASLGVLFDTSVERIVELVKEQADKQIAESA